MALLSKRILLSREVQSILLQLLGLSPTQNSTTTTEKKEEQLQLRESPIFKSLLASLLHTIMLIKLEAF